MFFLLSSNISWKAPESDPTKSRPSHEHLSCDASNFARPCRSHIIKNDDCKKKYLAGVKLPFDWLIDWLIDWFDSKKICASQIGFHFPHVFVLKNKKHVFKTTTYSYLHLIHLFFWSEMIHKESRKWIEGYVKLIHQPQFIDSIKFFQHSVACKLGWGFWGLQKSYLIFDSTYLQAFALTFALFGDNTLTTSVPMVITMGFDFDTKQKPRHSVIVWFLWRASKLEVLKSNIGWCARV